MPRQTNLPRLCHAHSDDQRLLPSAVSSQGVSQRVAFATPCQVFAVCTCTMGSRQEATRLRYTTAVLVRSFPQSIQSTVGPEQNSSRNSVRPEHSQPTSQTRGLVPSPGFCGPSQDKLEATVAAAALGHLSMGQQDGFCRVRGCGAARRTHSHRCDGQGRDRTPQKGRCC